MNRERAKELGNALIALADGEVIEESSDSLDWKAVKDDHTFILDVEDNYRWRIKPKPMEKYFRHELGGMRECGKSDKHAKLFREVL